MNSNNKEVMYSYGNSESMERSTFLRPTPTPTTTSFTSYQEQPLPVSILSSERFVTLEEGHHQYMNCGQAITGKDMDDIHEHHYDDSSRKMTETEMLSHSSSHDRTKASAVASTSATMRQNIISKFHQRKLPIRTQIDEYQQWQQQQAANVDVDDNNIVPFDLYDDSDNSVSNTVSAKEVQSRIRRDNNDDDYVDKSDKHLASSANSNKRRGRRNNKQGNALNETKQSQTRPTEPINMENNESTFNIDTKTAMKRKQYDESIITGPKKRNKSSSQQQNTSKSANKEETHKSSPTVKATKAKNNSGSGKDTTNKIQKQRHHQDEHLLPGLKSTKDKDMQSKIQVCAKIAKTLRIQARKNDGKLSMLNIKQAVGAIYNALGYTCNTTEIIQLMKYTGDDDDNDVKRCDSDHKPSKTNKRSILHVKKSKKDDQAIITKPKRPLSGYNLFFKVERDRLVKSRQLGITQQQQQELQTINNTIVGDHGNLENTNKHKMQNDLGLYFFMEPYTTAEIDLAAKASKISKSNQTSNNNDNKGAPSLFGYGELARIIGDKWKKLNENDRKLFENFASTEQEEYRSERQRSKMQGINHTISGDCSTEKQEDVDMASRHDNYNQPPLQKARKTRKRPKDNPKVHDISSEQNTDGCHPTTTLCPMPPTANVEEPSFYQMLLWEQQRRLMARDSSNDVVNHNSNKQANLVYPNSQLSGNIELVAHDNANKYRGRTENKMASNVNKTLELNGDDKQKIACASHINNATVRNKEDDEVEGIDRKRTKLSPEDIVVEEFLARRASSLMENDDISIGSINTVQSSSKNIGQETGIGGVIINGTSVSHSWDEKGVTSQGKPSELKACESYSCDTNHRPKISHDLIQPSGTTTGPKADVRNRSNSLITKQPNSITPSQNVTYPLPCHQQHQAACINHELVKVKLIEELQRRQHKQSMVQNKTQSQKKNSSKNKKQNL